MRTACLLPMIAALLVTATAQAQQKTPKQTTEPEGPSAKTISGVARIQERPTVLNHMRALGTFYKAYVVENGSVKDVAAFKNYIRRDAPKIVQQINGDYLVVVPKLRNPGSNNIVAFEHLADVNDQHVVAMGDGSVQQMNTAKLRETLKAN